MRIHQFEYDRDVRKCGHSSRLEFMYLKEGRVMLGPVTSAFEECLYI